MLKYWNKTFKFQFKARKAFTQAVQHILLFLVVEQFFITVHYRSYYFHFFENNCSEKFLKFIEVFARYNNGWCPTNMTKISSFGINAVLRNFQIFKCSEFGFTLCSPRTAVVFVRTQHDLSLRPNPMQNAINYAHTHLKVFFQWFSSTAHPHNLGLW